MVTMWLQIWYLLFPCMGNVVAFVRHKTIGIIFEPAIGRYNELTSQQGLEAPFGNVLR
jgi:hypothetical protein